MTITIGTGRFENQRPVIVAANAPKNSCPSPPTLKSPPRAPIAVASPKRQRVMDFSIVLPITRGLPSAPSNIAPYPSIGLKPVTSIMTAPINRATIILAARDAIYFVSICFRSLMPVHLLLLHRENGLLSCNNLYPSCRFHLPQIHPLSFPRTW